MTPPYELSALQRTALLASPAPARFKHFIGRAADYECVWGLRDASGWVALADETGAHGFPVWPHPDYASACATDAWTGNHPVAIDVYEFTEAWLPDMAARGVSVAVFPTPSMQGVWMAAEELRQCLAEELRKVE